MDFEEFKQKICNDSLEWFKANTPYRLDDVWDYVCEHFNWDKDFHFYWEEIAQEYYHMSFENVFMKYLNEQKYKLNRNTAKDFSILLGKKLNNMFEEKLKKVL